MLYSLALQSLSELGPFRVLLQFMGSSLQVPLGLAVLALASSGSVTRIELILSVSRHPRWTRQAWVAKSIIFCYEIMPKNLWQCKYCLNDIKLN